MIPGKETIALIHQLQEYVLAEPKRNNMKCWIEAINPQFYDKLNEHEAEELYSQRPPCGTVGCLAGLFLIMTGKVKPQERIVGDELFLMGTNADALACQGLGISEADGHKLFYLPLWGYQTGWPLEFEERLRQTVAGTPEYARVLVDRLEHYVQVGE